MKARTQRQLTNLPDGLAPAVPVFSPDGRWLAFTASRGGLEPEDLPWNGPLVRSMENVTRERRLGIVAAQGGDVAWVPTVGATSGVQFAGDGALVYQELSPDGKTREIKTVRAGRPAARAVARPRRQVVVADQPRRQAAGLARRQVAGLRQRSHRLDPPLRDAGRRHRRVAGARRSPPGTFGVGLGSWSPDSRRLAYHHSAAGNQMERFVDVVDVATGRSTPVVTARGVNLDPLFAPDGQRLVFQRTDVENSLDLYVARGARRRRAGAAERLDAGRAQPRRSGRADAGAASRAGSTRRRCPSTLMLPKNLDKSRKHPAIVWIHGSGSDQNFLGWHPGSYRMYYSVSQYLVQQGYIVLTPDYRGSSGYSRDWATGVHMGLGVSDAADVASGADYLKTLDYVDPDRIGVWGLSYGGYLTLQAMNADPLLWRCGINVAGVVDWATYGAGYTTPRLGTPVENPEIYRVSAPIYHMEKLARPLLILHGTNDRNVQFRDSLRVIDALLKLDKPFEMGVYPGEIHFFRRAHILRDAWRRAEAFFDAHLKHGPGMSSQ